MKKIEITACVFMAVFAAIACAGIAVGHDLTSYGAAFALPFFAVARVALAIRDWRKEAHK